MGKTRIYARIHMFLAFSVWLIEYLAIIAFNSPVAVAVASVSLGVLNVFIGSMYISKILNISIIELFPFKLILKILIHVLSITILLKCAFNMLEMKSPIIELSLALGSFIILLFATSLLFGLDYLGFIRPIIATNRVFIALNLKIKK
jgi:hypothetical protein